MPVEFLSDDEAAAFGRFAEDPTQAELERYFFLDDEDRKLVEQHRGQHNRPGFAVQMCTVRYLGTFLADPLMIPTAVADYLAAQLKIEDPSCLKHYAARQNTQWEHTAEIRDEFGYYDFAEKREAVRAFLLAQASTRVESSKALFDAVVTVMREQQVLLPGVSILTRLVSECREAAAANLHTTLCEGAREADAWLPERLVGLLEVPEGSRFSGLERLRRGPTRVSGRSMTDALKRAEELAELGAGAVDVSEIPVNRLEALARDGLAAKAQAIDRRDDEHKVATLVATVRSLTSSAVDDALDVFGVLMATKLIKVAERVSKETKLATLPKLSKASVTLAAACGVLLTALEEAGEHAVEQAVRWSWMWRAWWPRSTRWRRATGWPPRWPRWRSWLRRTTMTTRRGGRSWWAGGRWCGRFWSCWRRWFPLVPTTTADRCWTRRGNCRTWFATRRSARTRSVRSWWWARGASW